MPNKPIQLGSTQILMILAGLLTIALTILQPFFRSIQKPSSLDSLGRSLGISIVTADPVFPVKATYGLIEGHKAAEKEREAYARLFISEFALYPRELIAKSGLRRIVFCTDLAFAGQRRNAIPDFENDTLYLEVIRGATNPIYMRKVIHHEFYHMIDLRDDGQLYGDERWKALNPEGFRYGTGGARAQGVTSTSRLTDQYPGFLNHYSTTGVEEDKAEIFANLMVEPDHVEKQCGKDSVLRSKVERLKNLMISFCSVIDGSFWNRARKLKR